MTKLLAATILLIAPLVGWCQGNPPPYGAYTFSAGSWAAALTSATGSPAPSTPPPAALYCFNSGANTWVPADSSCFGGGGGSGTVNAGTTGQVAYYASNGTAVSGTSALPNGTTATTQTTGDNSTKVATTAYVASPGAIAPSSVASTGIVSGSYWNIPSLINGVNGIEYHTGGLTSSPFLAPIVQFADAGASAITDKIIQNINAGTLQTTLTIKASGVMLPGVLFSVAGTALPSCVTGLKGGQAVVIDATLPTFLGTYTGGGAVVSPVMCNGSNWVTY